MPHPLDGARAKFHRADEHFKTLDAEIPGFLEREPYEFRAYLNPQAGEYAIRLHVLEPPPLRWGVIVGEIAHALRSLLDLLARQLVVINGGVPGDHTAFPLTRRPYRGGSFADVAGTSSLRGAHPDAIAFIEHVQPYNGPHGVKYHPLAVLDDLWNEDKHRVVPQSFAAIPEHKPDLHVEGVRDCTVEEFWLYVNRPLQDGADAAGGRVSIEGPDPKVQAEGSVPFDIAFGEAMVRLDGLVQIRESIRRLIKGAEQFF